MPPPAKRHSITKAASELAGAERALHTMLVRLLGRQPTDRELQLWHAKIAGGMTATDFILRMSSSRAFLANPQIGTKTPAGHFYSPVVDPETVRGYVDMNRAQSVDSMHGIDFPLDAMAEFWRANSDFIATTPFQNESDGFNRYSYATGPYPFGDGVVLRAMINHYRPKHIIEIGSGYSTACMLDTIDHLGLVDLQLTCIEPNPERLFSILRPEDKSRIKFHQKFVQDMQLDVFRALQRNDILFIDSSHVLKTGSDVHYELFYILPVLAPGVIVHFHDCRFPFEYSDMQIFIKNFSWNEVYAVRALLMYSKRFHVLFHNTLFAKMFPELSGVSPPFKFNPGAAIWIQVQG